MYNPQLETFLCVAEAGSFNKAAERLYISPPAVIKQINLLEESLGLQLFVRTHRGLRLTAAGQSLRQDAKYIIQYCKDSVTRARNAMQESENVIRIGTSPMTPAQVLVDLWPRLQAVCPGIKFQLVPYENTPENAREILANVDHANVLYQIPENDTELPMVFLHGYGQSRMGWMTTPDGREGWSDMFLRKGHSVWLIDQPRRGEAGQTSVAGTMTTTPSDQTWYTQFRIGTYLNDQFTYNEGSQFPRGEEVLDQFFRQMTPDTGMDNDAGDQAIDNTVVAQAVAATIDEVYARTGKDSILVTHSQGGLPGWEVPRYTDHVAAIVAIEPGGAPQVGSEAYNAMAAQNIPVAFYYGDYIGAEYADVPAAAMWSMMASTADTFTKAYTAVGCTSTVVHLPDEGITGNDHFMFQDLNNDVIADHIENWIRANVQ